MLRMVSVRCFVSMGLLIYSVIPGYSIFKSEAGPFMTVMAMPGSSGNDFLM